MLRYAYHHGISTLALENPGIVGMLRLVWVRNGVRGHENYSWRVAIFRSSVIERIAMKVSLYGLHIEFVDPRDAAHSKEHDEVMRN